MFQAAYRNFAEGVWLSQMRKWRRRWTVRALIPSTQPKFLTGLTPAQKKLVLQSAELRKVQADRVIVSTGIQATSFFLLKTGREKSYRLTNKEEELGVLWI